MILFLTIGLVVLVVIVIIARRLTPVHISIDGKHVVVSILRKLPEKVI